jgi:hypothetical protein
LRCGASSAELRGGFKVTFQINRDGKELSKDLEVRGYK